MTETLFSGPEYAPSDTKAWHTAYCDGGSRGNPGPSGYGAVIEDARGKVVTRLSGYLGHQTNNYAEYQGLLAALKWAVENGARRLRVVSDSELMVKQMKGLFKVSSPSLRPLWEEARELAKHLDQFEMRHTLRRGNQEADQLANEAMDKGMGRTAGSRDQEKNTTAGKIPGKPEQQVFEGLVKNGVVHLLEGDLPEGTFVKVMRK